MSDPVDLERVEAFLNAADGDDGFVRVCRADLLAHRKEDAERERLLDVVADKALALADELSRLREEKPERGLK